MTASRVEPRADREAISQEGALQALGFGGLLAAGGVLAITALELPLICPLRFATGVPCPFCGMTTATVSLLRGDFGASVSANPFAPVVLIGAVSGFVDGLRKMTRRRSIVDLLSSFQLVRKIALHTFAAFLLGSWIFQLFRFDVL